MFMYLDSNIVICLYYFIFYIFIRINIYFIYNKYILTI